MLKRVLLALLALLALAVLGLLVASKWTPAAYRPPELSPEQQEEQMRRFVNHVNQFGDQAGAGGPIEWTLTQQQANDYLASMDAIASLNFDHPVSPRAQLQQAGLEAPAVAFEDGRITLMARSREYGAVVSVDLGFEFDPEGHVAANVSGVRVGELPLPQDQVQPLLQKVSRQLVARLQPATRAGGDGPVEASSQLLLQVLTMLDGQHVEPEFNWELGNRRRVRITGVDIADGRLTLRAQTVARRSSRASRPTASTRTARG